MNDKTQMVTIEAPVGALIITKEQIEPIFRQMFEDGITCAEHHFTNDDLVDEFFKVRLDNLLKPYREGTQQSKYGIGGKPL